MPPDPMNVNLTKIYNIWYRLRANFLFMPALMAIAALLLAFVTITMDRVWIDLEGVWPWLIYSGGPSGARQLLGVIAGSMMTVAGVVFSITIVVISLASSQYGPRLIRNFMEVRSNQMVLGTFVATFIYSIIVLHSVNGEEGETFVPHLSVTVDVVLAVVSLGVLIYFIHTISQSIRAENIIARVRHDLARAIERIFPEELGPQAASRDRRTPDDYVIPTDCSREACPVRSAHSGYLQAVDEEALMTIAVQENLLVHLGFRPGEFVTGGSILVTVWPGHRVDASLAKRLNAVFIMGPERILEQDVEFAIGQLAEIAVRALSPGINDPITANTCIDWLGVTLSQLAKREMRASHLFDQDHRLRVIRKTFTFDGMLDAAFNMIRQNSRSVEAVSIHLLETLATIAAQTTREADRTALRHHMDRVASECRNTFSGDGDLRDLEDRYQAGLASLDRAIKADTPPAPAA
jgi:uncharacterized membrane protein